jgi:hypothetical protein
MARERISHEDWELGALRWNWDEAYSITVLDGQWEARRLDGMRVMRASSAAEIRFAIIDDYVQNPVRRTRGSIGAELPPR